MRQSRRCPVCSKALSQPEYDKALKKLKSKLVVYQRTLGQPWRARYNRKPGLTRRELEIVATVVAGYSNKEIARHFRISEFTVKHHLTNIFDKIGVSTRLELALFTLKQ
jgi:two-component system, NarL family, nitrate/nitrite response regulator NarL